MEDVTKERWLAIRKEAGLKIDPETAEVEWIYAQTFDPYGVEPDLPEEYQQVGRAYFARSPGIDVWVWFGDLPEATAKALWEAHKSKLAFPAGWEHPLPNLSAAEREQMAREMRALCESDPTHRDLWEILYHACKDSTPDADNKEDEIPF